MLHRFLKNEAAGGLTLMAVTALALALANSPLRTAYHHVVEADLLGLHVEAWVNDVLMPVFFLLVGLEIKREFLHGQLRTWSSRMLPLIGAVGGVAVPALIFVALTWGDSAALRGWAIPAATDIAFALGVLSLLGSRVPASLKVFLTALAVLDDLAAVLIIAVFYTADLRPMELAAAAAVMAALLGLNRAGVGRLWPYLGLGVILWALVWRAGVHPTVAGVLLALTIPATAGSAAQSRPLAPLQRLEHALQPWAAFAILPVFAFVSAGVSIGADWMASVSHPVTLGVALGLVLGKQGGVMLGVWLAVVFRLAPRPAGARWSQVYGVALLCGIGFTMSLFMGDLAYPLDADRVESAKLGVLIGSALSAVAGALTLALAAGDRSPSPAEARVTGNVP